MKTKLKTEDESSYNRDIAFHFNSNVSKTTCINTVYLLFFVVVIVVVERECTV